MYFLSKGARSAPWADGLATGVAKAHIVILYRRPVGTHIDIMNIYDVGAPLAAGKSTGVGNFRSSPGKMIQLLKEFLTYALLTVF